MDTWKITFTLTSELTPQIFGELQLSLSLPSPIHSRGAIQLLSPSFSHSPMHKSTANTRWTLRRTVLQLAEQTKWLFELLIKANLDACTTINPKTGHLTTLYPTAEQMPGLQVSPLRELLVTPCCAYLYLPLFHKDHSPTPATLLSHVVLCSLTTWQNHDCSCWKLDVTQNYSFIIKCHLSVSPPCTEKCQITWTAICIFML